MDFCNFQPFKSGQNFSNGTGPEERGRSLFPPHEKKMGVSQYLKDLSHNKDNLVGCCAQQVLLLSLWLAVLRHFRLRLPCRHHLGPLHALAM